MLYPLRQTLVCGRVFVLREICVVSTATYTHVRRLYEEGYLC